MLLFFTSYESFHIPSYISICSGEDKVGPEDINKVLESYKEEIMSIPGVVGVYVSAMEDGSPCIKVMVNEITPEITGKLPSELEGYPVIIIPTGNIAPYKQNKTE